MDGKLQLFFMLLILILVAMQLLIALKVINMAKDVKLLKNAVFEPASDGGADLDSNTVKKSGGTLSISWKHLFGIIIICVAIILIALAFQGDGPLAF